MIILIRAPSLHFSIVAGDFEKVWYRTSEQLCDWSDIVLASDLAWVDLPARFA